MRLKLIFVVVEIVYHTVMYTLKPVMHDYSHVFGLILFWFLFYVFI